MGKGMLRARYSSATTPLLLTRYPLLRGMLPTLFQQIQDRIFPVFCVGCDTEGTWLCNNCKKTADMSGQFFCPMCHTQTLEGEPCEECACISAISGHVAISRYTEQSSVGKLLRALKYQYAEDVMTHVSNMIDQFVLARGALFGHIDIIIPVPLHKKRFAERGFNQAVLIARALSDATGVEVDETLVQRYRDTPHQATLTRAERLENVLDAFCVCVTDESVVLGKQILLVDDVFTTGATMQACAVELKAAGAVSVKGFCVARG